METLIYRGNKIERRRFHNQIREVNFNALITTYEMIIKDKAVLCRVRRFGCVGRLLRH